MGKKLDSPFDTIYFINHSHIDHTWWNSPDYCKKRNQEIITELLSVAAVEPDFRFSYETTASLLAYLEKYPDRKEEIGNLLRQRRLDAGGLFVSANDDVCSPEAIVRNFLYGTGWLQRTFEYTPKVAKEFDTPGHPVQLPQLVRGAGMKALGFTRGPQGIFYWAGPDGTEILTMCIPYNWSYWRKLGVNFEETEKRLPAELERAAQKFSGPDLVIPDGDDMTLPNAGLVEICKKWNTEYDRPKLRLATFDQVVDMFGRRRFTRRKGDIPNLWVVIHTLQVETTQKLRTIQTMLFSLELLSSIDCINKRTYKSYPTAALDSLWQRCLLVADHNWGGKDETRHGARSDEYKQTLMQKSLHEIKNLTENVFLSLTKSIMTKEPSLGMPILVFNPCSWQRDDIVSLNLDCGIAGLQAIEVVNAEGIPVPAGYDVTERHKDGSIHRASAEILARDIPSVGYSMFYVQPVLQKKEDGDKTSKNNRTIENDYYKVTFAEDGSYIESIYYKQLEKDLAQRTAVSLGPLELEFGTFELFGIGMKLAVPDQSYFEDPEHEGSGESVEPTGEIFRAGDQPATITATLKGGLSQTLTAEGEFAGASCRRSVTLYDGLKRIDLHVEFDWAGKPDVALFLQMPNSLMNGQKFIDVPFAVHTDGEELTDFWVDENMPVKFKIRGVQDWLAFEEEGLGLAIATRWPIIDLTSLPAFPLMWTNDSSGFFFGERYRQKGKHRFSFSLTSYRGTWLENRIHQWGKQWNNPVLTYSGSESAEVPSRSFISIGAPNVLLSAFKKAVDDETVIVRLYETAGKRTETELILSFPIKEAKVTNIIETTSRKIPAAKQSVKLKFGPFEIKTIKLFLWQEKDRNGS
jgi:alpha-mannosidase